MPALRILHSYSFVAVFTILCSLSVHGQSSQISLPQLDVNLSWVQLQSGEFVFGEVQPQTVSRTPNFILVDGHSYRQNEISAFRYDENEYTMYTPPGSPRPMLLQRVTYDHLSLYSEPGINSSPDFFGVDEGGVGTLSNANLSLALRGNPEAMRHLRTDRQYGNIAMISLAAGAAAVATGAAMEWGFLPNSGGMYVAASGVIVAAGINAVIPMMRRNAKMRAIDAYNASF